MPEIETSGTSEASRRASPSRRGRTTPGPWKTWCLRLVLLVVSCGFALGLAELAARWLQLAPPWRPFNTTAVVLFHEDPSGPIELAPNWEGYLGASTEPVRLNEHGFKDRVFPPRPPEGTLRVAVVGDSYTMGDGVSREDAYPKQLERLLSAELRCEVMNCGMTATNSSNQRYLVERLIEQYRPHVIVLGYNVNDFYYRPRTRFGDLEAAGFEYHVHPDKTVSIYKKAEGGLLASIKGQLGRHSYLYRFVQRLRYSRPRHGADKDRLETLIERQGHLKSFDAVEKMNAACRRAGVEFAVVVLPGLLNVPPTVVSMREYPLTKYHELIVESLQSRGVQVFDLAEAFGDRNPNHLIVHPTDRHYNPEGHRLIAGAIAERIEPLLREKQSEPATSGPR